MTQLQNRTLLITGGASGMGRLVARKAARLGARVVAWDIDPDGLRRVVEECQSESAGGAVGYACDVADRRDVDRAAARVRDEVGPVDVLINNAGLVVGKRLLEASPEEIERTLRVNTLALFWTVKALLPDMVRRGQGHLVTIASAGGLVGVNRMVDYCASKWGALGFHEALRVELRRTAPGVRTTVVCPFFVDTGMFAGVKTRFPLLLPILKPEYVAERIVAAIRRNKPRVLLPRIVGIVPLVRMLPVRLGDAVVSALGIQDTMNEFVGRSPDARTGSAHGNS